ncbi:hypothetical protein [Cellulomonas sp. URHB0016]
MDHRSVLAAAACLAALSACTLVATPPHQGIAATEMPTGLQECNHISVRGDPGLGAGFHYDDTARYAFGESARLVVCAFPWETGWERDGDIHELTADNPAVIITPVATIPRDGMVELRITVTGPVGESRTSMATAGAGWTGPGILSDDDEWWFSSWGDDASE